jgi:hypothetical protein
MVHFYSRLGSPGGGGGNKLVWFYNGIEVDGLTLTDLQGGDKCISMAL